MAFDFPFPPAPRLVAPIRNTERIGNSLIKINNNFANLQRGFCNLKRRVEDLVFVRTFFYYGQNSNTQPPTTGMQNNVASRPSNTTIQTFVNSTLNVPAISDLNDIVYVIYQKTGMYRRQAVQTYTGTVTVETGSNIPSEQTKVVSYSNVDADQGPAFDAYSVYSPVFIIWKLTARRVANNIQYSVDSGFPKFTQAETIANTRWDTPGLWNTYQI